MDLAARAKAGPFKVLLAERLRRKQDDDGTGGPTTAHGVVEILETTPLLETNDIKAESGNVRNRPLFRDEFHGLGSATVSVAAVGVSPTASFHSRYNSYRSTQARWTEKDLAARAKADPIKVILAER
jgi:hypothetical protein